MPSLDKNTGASKVTVTIKLGKVEGSSPGSTGQTKTKTFASYLNSTTLERSIANFIQDELDKYFKHGVIDGIIIKTQDRIARSFNGVFNLLNEYFAEVVKNTLIPWSAVKSGGTSQSQKFGIYTGSLVSSITPELIQDISNTPYTGSILETKMKSDVSIKGIMALTYNPSAVRKEQSNIITGTKGAVKSKQLISQYAQTYLQLYQAAHPDIGRSVTTKVQEWLAKFASEAVSTNKDIALKSSSVAMELKNEIARLRAELKQKINQAALNRLAQNRTQTTTQTKPKTPSVVPPKPVEESEVTIHLRKLEEDQKTAQFDVAGYKKGAKAEGYDATEIKANIQEGKQLTQELGVAVVYDYDKGAWVPQQSYLTKFADKGFPSGEILAHMNKMSMKDRATILAEPDAQWNTEFQTWLRQMFNPLDTVSRSGSITKWSDGKLLTISQKQIDKLRGEMKPCGLIKDQYDIIASSSLTWQNIQTWYRNVGFNIPESEARLIRLAVQSYTCGGDGPMRSIWYAWNAYLKDPRQGFNLQADHLHRIPDNLDHTQQNLNLLKQYARVAEFIKVAPTLPAKFTETQIDSLYNIQTVTSSTVYRGTLAMRSANPVYNRYYNEVTNLQVGSIFDMGPPGSWTTNINVAENYSKTGGATGRGANGKHYVFYIEAQDLTKHEADAVSIQSASWFPYESEVLLNTRQAEVVGITRKTVRSRISEPDEIVYVRLKPR